MQDKPLFRVGAAGLDPRDSRLIEIVFKHSQYNKYEYQLTTSLEAGEVDILIVNSVEPEGLQALALIRSSGRTIPVIAAVPRGAPSSARHAISIDRLTLQLLPILNRVVELELLSPETRPMGMNSPTGTAASFAPTGFAAPAPPFTAPAIQRPSSVPMVSPAVSAPPAGVPSLSGGLVSSAVGTAAAVPGTAESSSNPAMGLMAPSALPLPVSAAVPAPVPAPASAPAAGSLSGLAASAGQSSGSGMASAAPVSPATTTTNTAATPSPSAVPPTTPASAPAPVAPPSNLVAFPLNAADPPISQRLRVLVVDDSPTVRRQLTMAFDRLGIVCETAESAAQAIAKLWEQHFDLALVDVVMPEMDGYKLTREIKRNRHWRQLPVIILTSRSSPFDLARGALAGCDTYLTKPVPFRALEAAVVKQLRRYLAIDDLSGLMRTPTRPVAPGAAAPAPTGVMARLFGR